MPGQVQQDTLAELENLQTRMLAYMRQLPDWSGQAEHVEALQALDLSAIADPMADELAQAFEYWSQPQMTGEGGQAPLGAVVFEWSYEDEAYGCEAGASGYGRCTPRAGNVFIPRPEYDFEQNRFDFVGSVTFAELIGDPDADTSTQFTDFFTFKAAETLHHAIELALHRGAEAFDDLNKRDTLYFLTGRHDRWPALAYLWRG